MSQKGQSMLELVFGIGLITVVMGAMTVVTINTLRNTQFSKRQTQATKFAQENLEQVRTIKNSNLLVCLQGDIPPACTEWKNIWNISFGTVAAGTCTIASCYFEIKSDPAVCGPITGTNPYCLKSSSTGIAGSASTFTYQIIIEDEGTTQNQKRVTSRVFWNDSTSVNATGSEHSSDLVTILSRY